jgi:uncharacterized membrane protein YhaH (DUF805 family)
MSTTIVDEDVREMPRAPTPAPEAARYRYAAITVCGIWAALAAASIWSPDLIADIDRTHVPIAAFMDWIYAVIATGLVLLAFSRRTRDLGRSSWSSFAAVICGIWMLVAAASISAPSLISGTDGTTVPIAALSAPLAGLLATAFASVFAAGSPGDRTSNEGG